MSQVFVTLELLTRVRTQLKIPHVVVLNIKKRLPFSFDPFLISMFIDGLITILSCAILYLRPDYTNKNYGHDKNM